MNGRASTTALIALALLTTFASLAGSATANGDDNRGTIKVHDALDVDPDTRNQPHVSCDFYIQGFNMKDSSGYLVFYSWPPTGDKSVVTPTGDTLMWTGTPDGDGEFDFLKGAYQLPDGHYRVEAFTFDGHPGHDSGHFAKAKMFWVTPCGQEEPPTPPDDEDDCPLDVPADECVEIPFFPTSASLMLGVAGAVGTLFMVLRRRG